MKYPLLTIHEISFISQCKLNIVNSDNLHVTTSETIEEKLLESYPFHGR